MSDFPYVILLVLGGLNCIQIGIVFILFVYSFSNLSTYWWIILLILFVLSTVVIISWIIMVLLRFRTLAQLFQRMENVVSQPQNIQQSQLQTVLNELHNIMKNRSGCCTRHNRIEPMRLQSIHIEEQTHEPPRVFHVSNCLYSIFQSTAVLPDLRILFRSMENLVMNRLQMLRTSEQTLNATVEKDKATRDKNGLIRYLFHEIRVPLNAVCLALSELTKTSSLGAQWNEAELDLLAIGIQQTEAVARILNDVISLKKIDDGGLILEHVPFSLDGLIATTVKSFQVAIKEQQINLQMHLPSVPEFAFGYEKLSKADQLCLPRVDVIGDIYRIRQVLNNLLSNAIKFTPKTGTIKLIVSLQPTAPDIVKVVRKMIKTTSIPTHQHPTSPGACESDHEDKPYRVDLDRPLSSGLPPVHHQANTPAQQTPHHLMFRKLSVPSSAANNNNTATHSRKPSLKEQLESKFGTNEDMSQAILDMVQEFDKPMNILHSDTLVHSYVSITISIVDSGCGVPANMQNRLFQPYMQVLPSELQSGKGTGLGLNISKSLVELHGGRIWYQDGVSGGSEFSFQLHLPLQIRNPIGTEYVVGRSPAARREEITPTTSNEHTQLPPTPAAPASRAFTFPENLILTQPPSKLPTPTSQYRSILDNDLRINDESRTSLKSMQHLVIPGHTTIIPQTRTENDRNSYYRILVAEDSKPNLKLLMMMLKRLKYQVQGVENGQQVIDLFANALDQHLPVPFDLILMDGFMPIKTGIQATTELIALGIQIPIIAVTGNAMIEDIDLFMAAGAKDVIAKPINETQLVVRLDKFLHTS